MSEYLIVHQAEICLSQKLNQNFHRHQVAVVTGDAFGDPNCFRISYAASEETLNEAMRRIKEALSKLN